MKTRHLEEGSLQAHLDGELDPEDTRALQDHLDVCAACHFRLIELEGLAGAVRHVLEEADPALPSTEVARWAIRRASFERRRGGRRRLAAAASVVLLFGAGAAAAMPGSPVRAWLESQATGPSETVSAPHEVGALAQDASQDATASGESIGLNVAPVDEAISIALNGVPPGSWIEIEIVEGIRAFAVLPTGVALESGPGWMGARLDSARGDIRIEFPTGPHSRLEVDGMLVFSIRDGQVVHPAPSAPAPVGTTFRLAVPSGDGSPDADDADVSLDADASLDPRVPPPNAWSVSGTHLRDMG